MPPQPSVAEAIEQSYLPNSCVLCHQLTPSNNDNQLPSASPRPGGDIFLHLPVFSFHGNVLTQDLPILRYFLSGEVDDLRIFFHYGLSVAICCRRSALRRVDICPITISPDVMTSWPIDVAGYHCSCLFKSHFQPGCRAFSACRFYDRR